MIDIARAEERQRKTDDIDGWMYVVLRARSDYGFDPLKLGEKPENLARYREAELMHARWSMLGVAGAVAVEATGYGTWVDAQPTTWDGTAKYLGNETHAPLFAVIGVNALLMAYVESRRGAASAEERLYPGGQFDPAGLSKGKDFETLKRKELANGRVAMLAFLGIMAQNQANPGAGPVATLASHIADPWHVNVATNAAAIPWL
jgi:light-harvesting complex I chlorophyll a/b binding protein 1|tara:strand:+ start:804 stop:1415 length:612 start_codon:yes stop_codon:yes gene_type:complete